MSKATKKLSGAAYGDVSGKDYVPFVSSGSRLGGNAAVMAIGILLAALFAASTAYSGMKAGLTVAAGIPGSILGSIFVSVFAKRKGILGKSLLQGTASGGESIASGMIFVFPAILLIGSQVTFLEGFVVCVGGALLGIGGVSLVQKHLIVQEHGTLKFPESMAISESLVASEGEKNSIKYMGIGFGIGGVLTLLTGSFLNVANNVITFTREQVYKWRFQLEVNPLLLGIGFIVGLPTAIAMFAGSAMANFAVTPLIGYFTELGGSAATVWNDASVALNTMGVGDISGSYVKYIGAGIMLSGGLISAVKLIPTVVSSVKETLRGKGAGGSGLQTAVILLSGIAIGFAGGFLVSGGNVPMAVLGAVLCVLLSFLFIVVAGRLTGTIGTSNLPVSGMTIASIMLVTLLFVGMGWTSGTDNKALLLFGTFIVTAIAAAGGYSQSQKVAFIIGSDEKEMQKYYTVASVVGVVVVTGIILLFSNQLAMKGDSVPFALPQANLMAALTSGIMSGALPWVMIICGAVLGVVFFLLKLPVMTVAIGFYLPISTTSIILVGALIHVLVKKRARSDGERDVRISNGVSLSSGLVAGGSIVGLVGIILHVTGVIGDHAPAGFAGTNSMAAILLAALVISTILSLAAGKVRKNETEDQKAPGQAE